MSNVVRMFGAKAVVVRPDGDRFRVEMTPADTPAEKQVFLLFKEVGHARDYAHELTFTWGDLYERVVDLTEGREAI